MYTIIGDDEIKEDYQNFLSQHFEIVSSLLIQNFSNNTINSDHGEDSIFQVASIIDIIENYIFTKVDEDTKVAMILVCKPWAFRVFQVRQSNYYLTQKYSHSLYDQVIDDNGREKIAIMRNKSIIFSFELYSYNYVFFLFGSTS